MPDLFQGPAEHAEEHEDGGADELTVQNLGSGSALVDKIIVSDGSGGWTLEDVPAGSGGITESQHKGLRDLIHFLTEGPGDGFVSGAYLEVLPSADPFPTSEIWYTDNTKTDKIVELTTTYNGNKTIATEVWKMYDTDGSTVLVTLTDTHTYTGVFLDDTTRTWV